MSPTVTQHADVLVLGGGFAGVACARRLERLLPADQSITLVSGENYFVFQPLLPEVVGASLDPAHVISPLRQLLRRTKVVRGDVCGIVLEAEGGKVAGRATVCTRGVEGAVVFTGRHLVLALGSVVDVSRLPGMGEHSLLMKNVADALNLRHAILSRLEQAVLEPDARDRESLLTFVVVGGGFSGIETVAEIHDLVHAARKFFPSLAREPMRVVCVHARPQVLPELDPRLGAYALKLLQRRGVEFRLEQMTRAVSVEGVHLESGEVIRARTVVCTVGNAPHPVLKGLGTEVDGRLVTDAFLRLQGRSSVWAFGDCARTPDGRGGIAPPTAQFATRQGDLAARNLANTLAGRPLMPFRHKSLGQLATLGHLRAVAAFGPFRVSGFLAWWLWRTVYLLKLPRLDRKLRVMIDWTLNLFFPRDLNSLDVATTHGLGVAHLEAGEVLFRQGDPSATFYIVDSGAIELSRCDETGQTVARDRLLPGDHFGEGSLLRGKVRATTAIAVEPTTVLSFPARDFTRLTRCFAALRNLLEATSRRFQPAREVQPAWVPAATLRRPVREIMSAPAVTLPADATLRRCLGDLLERRFHCFPLVDGDGRLQGLVTGTDLFAALRRDLDLDRPLRDIATANVWCLSPDDPVERAVEIMRRRDVKHAVVVDSERRVVGIVSIKDVLRLVLGAAAPGAAAPSVATPSAPAPR